MKNVSIFIPLTQFQQFLCITKISVSNSRFCKIAMNFRNNRKNSSIYGTNEQKSHITKFTRCAMQCIYTYIARGIKFSRNITCTPLHCPAITEALRKYRKDDKL